MFLVILITLSLTEQTHGIFLSYNKSIQSICIPYTFEKGFCRQETNFLIHPQSNNIKTLKRIDSDLVKNFKFLEVIISKINSDQEESAKIFLKSILEIYANIKLSNRNIDIIVKNVQKESFNGCLKNIKKLICGRYFPKCALRLQTTGSYIYSMTPCKEMCEYIELVKCKEQVHLLNLLRKLNVFTASEECKTLKQYNETAPSCFASKKALAYGNIFHPKTTTTITTTTTAKTTVTTTTSTPINVQTTLPTSSTAPKVQPTENTQFLDIVCPVYESVLPAGECKDVMSGVRIAQSFREARFYDDELTVFYRGAYRFINLWFASGNARKSYLKDWLGSCMDIPIVKEIFDNVRIPSLDEIKSCINKTKHILCIQNHPICLYERLINSNGGRIPTYRVLPSKPCKNECELALNECNVTISFLKAITIVKNVCPKINKLNNRGINIPSCEENKNKNMMRIEQCQNHHFSGKWEQQNDMCYNGVGNNYNGTVKITSSGLPCVPWNKNPYLLSNIYPSLKNNYCRNPQGYGTSPWCYVNMTTREWEYCDIEPCHLLRNPNASKVLMFITNHPAIFAVIVATVVLALSVIIVLLLKRSLISFRKNKGVTEAVDCYAEVSLRTAADISEQLHKTELASDETTTHLYCDETLQKDDATYKEYVDD